MMRVRGRAATDATSTLEDAAIRRGESVKTRAALFLEQNGEFRRLCDANKVKGVIIWLSAAPGNLGAWAAEVRLYDRLTQTRHRRPGLQARPQPRRQEDHPDLGRTQRGGVAAETRLQIERFRYFAADQYDHQPGEPVFNRVTGLRDTWAK